AATGSTGIGRIVELICGRATLTPRQFLTDQVHALRTCSSLTWRQTHIAGVELTGIELRVGQNSAHAERSVRTNATGITKVSATGEDFLWIEEQLTDVRRSCGAVKATAHSKLVVH